jgi:hypothetical protein
VRYAPLDSSLKLSPETVFRLLLAEENDFRPEYDWPLQVIDEGRQCV